MSRVARAVDEAGFRYDAGQDIVYSRMDARQRKLGYGFGYDDAAILMSSDLHCEPIFFDYDGKHWMVELWKGQYGLETGCEIGVYTRSMGQVPRRYKLFDLAIGRRPMDDVPSHDLFYDCATDDDRLELTATLHHSGETLFTRGPEVHWWLTGFRWGVCSSPEDLSVDIAITLKDRAMVTAFEAGIKGREYTNYRVGNGTTVRFTFDQCFARPQPVVADELLAAVRADNKEIVELYNASLGPPHDPPGDRNNPNLVADRFLLRGLGLLHRVFRLGLRAVERALEANQPPSRIVDDLAARFLVPDTMVEQWLYSAQPLAPVSGSPKMSLMRFDATVAYVGLAAAPGAATGCYVTIDNSRGSSDLRRTAYAAAPGAYAPEPPGLVLRGGVGRFVLRSAHPSPGAAGTATYEYCDATMQEKTVTFSFGLGSGNAGASSSQPEWTPLTTGSDPTFPQDAASDATSRRFVRYVTNEHREVAYVDKDTSGRVARLRGRVGAYWDQVAVGDALAEIESGHVTYFVRGDVDFGARPVRVVRGPHGPYLRTSGRAGSPAGLRHLGSTPRVDP